MPTTDRAQQRRNFEEFEDSHDEKVMENRARLMQRQAIIGSTLTNGRVDE
ncbi:hypothetical protein ISF_01719 [Cordyceps fumosorosea ARSEF 2679]|uniref:Uncharacterized protein n=1 Tax=Cordyceps fumosorosea (strain ARSEF 2679) TaxID=1081104 RepID=A0A168CAX4_CORFA|nr:hypothetical protein ISF_01719 [Cordyceps fumosorosea ARSEF 2679]OAA71168.1 hypothetical protein ISF_01719 [Cordyceps fumosorosea ARSEF 2679]